MLDGAFGAMEGIEPTTPEQPAPSGPPGPTGRRHPSGPPVPQDLRLALHQVPTGPPSGPPTGPPSGPPVAEEAPTPEVEPPAETQEEPKESESTVEDSEEVATEEGASVEEETPEAEPVPEEVTEEPQPESPPEEPEAEVEDEPEPNPSEEPQEESSPVEEASEELASEDSPAEESPADVDREMEIARLTMEIERLRGSLTGAVEVIEEIEETPMPPVVLDNSVIPPHVVADFARMGRQLSRESLVKGTMGAISMLHPDEPGLMIVLVIPPCLPGWTNEDLLEGALEEILLVEPLLSGKSMRSFLLQLQWLPVVQLHASICKARTQQPQAVRKI